MVASDYILKNQSIKRAIADFIGTPVSKLDDDAPVMQLMGDSFMVVELLVGLQEQFNIHLRNEDLKQVVSLSDLVSLIASRPACRVAVEPGAGCN